jgi:hypothetical protein
MSVNEFIGIGEEEMFVKLFLEVMAVGVGLAGAPRAVEEPPRARDEDGIPGVVYTFARNERMTWNTEKHALNQWFSTFPVRGPLKVF